jgi:hypothetical protein
VGGRRLRRAFDRLRMDCVEATVLGPPHAGRQHELGGPSGRDTESYVGDDVELAGAVADCPHEGGTEPAAVVGRFVDEYPSRVTGEQGGAERKVLGGEISGEIGGKIGGDIDGAEMPADDSGELAAEQAGAPLSGGIGDAVQRIGLSYSMLSYSMPSYSMLSYFEARLRSP